MRAILLLPWIVPTTLSAIAFWWMYDSQFSVISWVLIKAGLIDRNINFLGDPWNARFSVVAANIWRGIPFVAICLLAGLQTISPSYVRSRQRSTAPRRGNASAHHFAAADADHRGRDDVFGAVYVHRFSTDLRAHARRAGQRHASDGDAFVSNARYLAANWPKGPHIAMAMVPFLIAAVLVSFFGLQRRAWQQGGKD